MAVMLSRPKTSFTSFAKSRSNIFPNTFSEFFFDFLSILI